MHAGVDSEMARLGAVAVGRGPIGDIAADTAGGGSLVVTNYGDDSVSFIDADNLTVDSTILVGGEPLAAAVADNRVYVGTASASYDSVAVINTDTRTVIAINPLAFNITSVAVGPDGKHVFVGRTGRDVADLAVIDVTNDEVSTIEITTGEGVIVDAVRVGPDGQRVCVATSNTHGGRLVVVDPEAARAIGSVTIGSPIRDVAVSADGSAAYVLAYDPRRGGAVDIVDMTTSEIVAAAEIGGSPTQLTLSPDGTRAYIVHAEHVAVVCTVTHEIVDTLTVGARPSCVATSPDGSRLYVADYAGMVTAFSAVPAMSPQHGPALALDVIAASEVRELETAAV